MTMTKPIYHPGELAVQERVGVQEEAARLGRSVRRHIPPSAETFLHRQPMVIVATVDGQGRVWASLVTGEPGFLRAEDDRTLRIAARLPSGDPLAENLTERAHLGVLVIDLATRRRMRLNGTLAAGVGDGIRVVAEQVYWNCPKYIQARSWRTSDEPVTETRTMPTRGSSLTDEQQQWVARADTFFIASWQAEAGADASHRGGPPGFISVVDRQHLAWGDYAGNNMFQTLGNISANPRTGLLFIDFEVGRTLQLTGSSRIVWDRNRTAAFAGARRLLEFDVDDAIEIAHATRLRWQFLDPSPFNPPAQPQGLG